MKILEGGIESGFNHVKPEEYEPRLLQFKGKKHVKVTQVPLKRFFFDFNKNLFNFF